MALVTFFDKPLPHLFRGWKGEQSDRPDASRFQHAPGSEEFMNRHNRIPRRFDSRVELRECVIYSWKIY